MAFHEDVQVDFDYVVRVEKVRDLLENGIGYLN